MKMYKKCEFGKDKLLKMQGGDNILVICDTYKEVDSVRQICYNTRLREPRNDVECYLTEKASDGNMVLIKAVAKEVY